MVFSSIPFIFFFLPLFFLIYYLVPTKYKNYILLMFSLIFYAWGEPIYIFLMIFTTYMDYLNGRLYVKEKTHKKRYLIISLIIDLGLLSFFKYSDFIIGIINGLLKINIPLLNIGLPIGISFYTFQTLSYSIDVYKDLVKPENNYFRYLTYVSMFPQLIAGPIVRYENVNNELKFRKVSINMIADGFTRFLRGLFKKVLLANNIGYLFTIINSNYINSSVLLLWMGVSAFTFQIYFDFSGYSDMAIGLGKMLGFNYLENFNYPYMATSITDFWHRWHISLSSWFKDYVYIPLGGSRVKKIINMRNIMIVWSLTGLWHGASWNFVIWGIYYGSLLIIEKFVLNRYIELWPKFIKHIYTMIIVIIGWAIFANNDILLLGTYLSGMFGFNHMPLIDSNFKFFLSNYFILFVLCIICSLPIKLKSNMFINIIKIIGYVVLFIITISFLVSDSYNPFLYFRF